MSIALLAPLGLVALVALVLPILIHLVRRIELTTTEFAALRWIAQRMQPRRNAIGEHRVRAGNGGTHGHIGKQFSEHSTSVARRARGDK